MKTVGDMIDELTSNLRRLYPDCLVLVEIDSEKDEPIIRVTAVWEFEKEAEQK